MTDKYTLTGNPHARNLARGYTTEAPADAATCQIEATLALAFEQRTASLIAYATARFADGSPMFPADIDGAREVIYARLGLDGDDS